MRIPIKGIEARIIGDTLVVSSEIPLKILSSDVLEGGFFHARYILNHRVELDYDHDSPAGDMEKVLDGIGIKEKAAGMMTAVDLENIHVTTCEDVTAVITGGVTNAIASGEKQEGVGTINIILLIDANLSDAAMVNTVINATEAKTLALRDLNVKSKRSDELATGTSTDTIVIACTGKGEKLKYTGNATAIGECIGLAVRKATREAIIKQEKLLSI